MDFAHFLLLFLLLRGPSLFGTAWNLPDDSDRVETPAEATPASPPSPESASTTDSVTQDPKDDEGKLDSTFPPQPPVTSSVAPSISSNEVETLFDEPLDSDSLDTHLDETPVPESRSPSIPPYLATLRNLLHQNARLHHLEKASLEAQLKDHRVSLQEQTQEVERLRARLDGVTTTTTQSGQFIARDCLTSIPCR